MRKIGTFIFAFMLGITAVVSTSCNLFEPKEPETIYKVTFKYLSKDNPEKWETSTEEAVYGVVTCGEYYCPQGYILVNWKDDDGNIYELQYQFTTTKDLTLTAQYSRYCYNTFYIVDETGKKDYEYSRADYKESYTVPGVSDITTNGNSTHFINWTVLTENSVKTYNPGETINLKGDGSEIFIANYDDYKSITIVYDYKDGSFKLYSVEYYAKTVNTFEPVQLFKVKIEVPEPNTGFNWICYKFNDTTKTIEEDSGNQIGFFDSLSSFGAFDSSMVIRPKYLPKSYLNKTKQMVFYPALILNYSGYLDSLSSDEKGYYYIPESSSKITMPLEPVFCAEQLKLDSFDTVYYMNNVFTESGLVKNKVHCLTREQSTWQSKFITDIPLSKDDFKFEGWFQYDVWNYSKPLPEDAFDMNHLVAISYCDNPEKVYKAGEEVSLSKIKEGIPFWAYWTLTDSAKERIKKAYDNLPSANGE